MSRRFELPLCDARAARARAFAAVLQMEWHLIIDIGLMVASAHCQKSKAPEKTQFNQNKARGLGPPFGDAGLASEVLHIIDQTPNPQSSRSAFHVFFFPFFPFF